jgi:hypothetical protein
VRLDDGSEVTGVWPPGAAEPGAGALEVPVRHDGADVGRLLLDLPPQAAPSASRRRVLREFCEQAAPAFRTTALEESLRAGAIRLAGVDAQLAASRQRLLAAEDSGRRQVASAIRVGVVSGLREVPDRLATVVAASGRDPAAAVRLVDGCVAATTDALEQLRDITRTISPPMLAQRGLHAALVARRVPPGATVDVRSAPAPGTRWPEEVEACAYFCCAELLRGAGGAVRVLLGADPEALVVSLAFARGAGPAGPQLEAAADRAGALDGSLVRSGREVRLTIPGPRLRALGPTPG